MLWRSPLHQEVDVRSPQLLYYCILPLAIPQLLYYCILPLARRWSALHQEVGILWRNNVHQEVDVRSPQLLYYYISHTAPLHQR